MAKIQRGGCDLRVVLSDVLGLTRINFNSCLYKPKLLLSELPVLAV